MIFLQNYPKVDQKMTSWRLNRDVKINITTQHHIYFVWEEVTLKGTTNQAV